MNTITAYALSKSYTDLSIEGLGSIKGADCRVDSVVPITNGHRVTLSWTGSSGTIQTKSFDVLDGYTITNIYIDENKHLICVLSDGSEHDAGKMPESDVEISQAEGNVLQKKDDGLYVPETAVNISEQTDNIIVNKTDGLYASIPIETEDIDFDNF